MSSRDTNPRIPNQGGSGRIRGNARADGPVNTLVDTFKRAAPFWHHRLAGKAISLATGMSEEMGISLIHAIDALLERGASDVQIRCALNDLLKNNPSGFGVIPAGDSLDWLREELGLEQ